MQEHVPASDSDPKVAGAIIWTVNLIQLVLLFITIVSSLESRDTAEGGELSEEKKYTASHILHAIKDPELLAYVTLATIPFLRTFCFCILLSDTQVSVIGLL